MRQTQSKETSIIGYDPKIDILDIMNLKTGIVGQLVLKNNHRIYIRNSNGDQEINKDYICCLLNTHGDKNNSMIVYDQDNQDKKISLINILQQIKAEIFITTQCYGLKLKEAVAEMPQDRK